MEALKHKPKLDDKVYTQENINKNGTILSTGSSAMTVFFLTNNTKITGFASLVRSANFKDDERASGSMALA